MATDIPNWLFVVPYWRPDTSLIIKSRGRPRNLQASPPATKEPVLSHHKLKVETRKGQGHQFPPKPPPQIRFINMPSYDLLASSVQIAFYGAVDRNIAMVTEWETFCKITTTFKIYLVTKLIFSGGNLSSYFLQSNSTR